MELVFNLFYCYCDNRIGLNLVLFDKYYISCSLDQKTSLDYGGINLDIIILWIVSIIILYVVIYAAVKTAINNSEVGQIIIKKYGIKEEIVTISDEEIEKELEVDEFRSNS